MKRKFLTIAICLMICLSSMIALGGCKKETNEISQRKAENALETAIEKIETSSAVKIESDTFFGKVLVIATEDTYYEEDELTGSQYWTKKEGDSWYEYFTSTVIIGEHPSIEFAKRLALKTGDDPREFALDGIEEYSSARFLKATKKGEKLNIVYKEVEDDVTTKITFIIVKGNLKTITLSSGAISLATRFEYGVAAFEAMPQFPNGVEWDVYVPSIDVSGLSQIYYVGDELDLTNAVIEYYEDDDTIFPEEFALTADMITNFSTQITGTHTMTITFYGLTLEVDYEVFDLLT